ncbi:hypothetical protein ONS95_006367 [Cadophora gregata]|uniref:uncharacterized protein n=1 Tax=Cadophora gregata TaxID=51156 RepID=UPI0026DAFF0D|nr:uncharacterized protein ONS95_006367 [Cadophora gregata]KAK0102770.1 hypothetical protein ONS95_006367 [Cadophora gregata]
MRSSLLLLNTIFTILLSNTTTVLGNPVPENGNLLDARQVGFPGGGPTTGAYEVCGCQGGQTSACFEEDRGTVDAIATGSSSATQTSKTAKTSSVDAAGMSIHFLVVLLCIPDNADMR